MKLCDIYVDGEFYECLDNDSLAIEARCRKLLELNLPISVVYRDASKQEVEALEQP